MQGNSTPWRGSWAILKIGRKCWPLQHIGWNGLRKQMNVGRKAD